MVTPVEYGHNFRLSRSESRGLFAQVTDAKRCDVGDVVVSFI